MATATKNPATTRTVTKTIEVQEEVPASITLTLTQDEAAVVYALVNKASKSETFKAVNDTHFMMPNGLTDADKADKAGWQVFNALMAVMDKMG